MTRQIPVLLFVLWVLVIPPVWSVTANPFAPLEPERALNNVDAISDVDDKTADESNRMRASRSILEGVFMGEAVEQIEVRGRVQTSRAIMVWLASANSGQIAEVVFQGASDCYAVGSPALLLCSNDVMSQAKYTSKSKGDEELSTIDVSALRVGQTLMDSEEYRRRFE